MTPSWVKPLAAGLIGGVILGLLMARGQPVSETTLFRVDTVLAEGPVAAQVRDSLNHVVTVVQKEARQSHTEAARLKRVADSLLSERPETTVVTMREVVDTLVVAYTALDSAYQSQLAATAGLRAEVLIAESRIQTLERTLTEARGALAKTRKPSRFGLGCAAGYGVASSGGVVRTGPALACGLSYRLR